MDIDLVAGRLLRQTDDAEGTPVVLINETAAKRYWLGEDPLLSRVYIGGSWRRVVGVVADTKHFGLDSETRPALYFPYAQLALRFMSLVVRTRGEAVGLSAAIQAAVGELDPSLAVASVSTMREVVAETTARPRAVTMLLALFAGVAMLLAAIGLYGVMSYAVRRRTHEIGVRMALGATATDVLRSAVGRGMTLMLAGVAIGLVGATFASRLMEGLLFGVSRSDPLTFVIGPLVLGFAALVACVVPARRASRTDPVIALRYE